MEWPVWLAAVVVGVPAAWFFWFRGEVKKARKAKPIDDALRHEMARSRGYTHRLVTEEGAAIGTVEETSFWPGGMVGETYVYRGVTYQVVAVTDDYPEASGTLVLLPTSGQNGT